jgi:hypothetical protein
LSIDSCIVSVPSVWQSLIRCRKGVVEKTFTHEDTKTKTHETDQLRGQLGPDWRKRCEIL